MKRSGLIIIVLMALAGTFWGISCTRDKPNRLYVSAIDATAKGDIEAADNTYKTIIKRYPNSSVRKDALYQLGLLEYLYLNDYTSALEHFYDLVYTYPHYDHTFDAYMYIAQIYREQQHLPQKAVEIYEKLLNGTTSTEQLKRLLPRLASEYENRGDIRDALDTYQRLLKQYDRPPANYLYEYAYLQYLAGKYGEAIKGFQQVGLLYPESHYRFSSQIAIADCYEETGRSEDALSLLNGLKAAYPTKTSIISIKIDSIEKRIRNKKK